MSYLKQDWRELHERAYAAGRAAAMGTTPPTMIVSQHADMLDDTSPVVKQWIVPEGPCGFAWVNIKPGNSPFANWLKTHGLARKDEYYGGVTVWIGEYNQSITRKECHAHAYARVLQEAGIRANAMSRMD